MAEIVEQFHRAADVALFPIQWSRLRDRSVGFYDIGQHEPSALREPLRHTGKEVRLRRSVHVMQGKRGNDQLERPFRKPILEAAESQVCSRAKSTGGGVELVSALIEAHGARGRMRLQASSRRLARAHPQVEHAEDLEIHRRANDFLLCSVIPLSVLHRAEGNAPGQACPRRDLVTIDFPTGPSKLLSRMATFSTRFLGCKVSFADEQAIRERLLSDGHVEVNDGGEIQVVNTCCVTHEAVSKSRQAAARAARTAHTVYVTGCASNLQDAFAGAAPNVVVTRRTGEAAAAFVAGDVGAIGCVNAEHRLDRVRAFVKIQDGCSFSCAFCVIPLVRGATRSRTAAAVLAEVRRRVAQGHREIVLTGVNLGCFRDREAGCTLAGLVRACGAVEGLERLRLSSIEVNHVTDELVTALRETAAVSSHLHVPLQSGDDRVLRAMGRRYTTSRFESRIEALHDFNLTSDVIVGFPVEDDDAFERTLALVARLGMSKVHVFPYSPRPGTRTAGDDAVPPDVKRERGRRLRSLSDSLSRRRWEARIGSTDRVLVDRPGRGYADDYTPWLVEAEVGALVTARAVGVGDGGVLAVAA